jgi:hypothetical protein
MTEEEYKEYRQGAHWRAFSESTKKARPFCENENCPLDVGGISRDDSRDRYNKDLHVHHPDYESLGYETQDDVQVLCFKCHDAVHGIDREYLFFNEDDGTWEVI